MERVHGHGLFEARLVNAEVGQELDYRLLVRRHGESIWLSTEDPYRFGLMLGEQDMYYFREGTHLELYRHLGAHPRVVGEAEGMCFAVWAPNAQRVSVVGDWNRWDGRVHPMRKRPESGIWELFIPGVGVGQHYKFELLTADGHLATKADPFAFFSQHGPATASIAVGLGDYRWGDGEWMREREGRDPYGQAMSIYEVHLGSWRRVPEEGDRPLSYLELGKELIEHVVEMGFTHLELMPIMEYPFDGSWGYQICGYFAPTSRFGSPDEFRAFVDMAHQAGLGVILDWVPGHFPKDAHGLARFDGTALYEHADPRRGEHPDWGTLEFNYGRKEVANFLIANALYWFEQFHIDGLRVDAVASMLYLDYSREPGQWVPNERGGREDLDAIALLRRLNEICYARHPGILMVAEESTAWAGVSRPTSEGGLGFGFKWNMGWMNDQLEYIERSPEHRKYHHGDATFSMIYAFDENFILPLSHDEVVHGKGSLLSKMPGDRWQRFANLRMFLAWMYAHPGKKLLFMGTEIAPWREWDHGHSLDWHLLGQGEHGGVCQLLKDLNRAHRELAALHDFDHDPRGFRWLDHDDADGSIFAFYRTAADGSRVTVVINATPVVREGYRVGVERGGRYREVLNTDSQIYGGSNVGTGGYAEATGLSWQGQADSLVLRLPPLASAYWVAEGA
jgi:1,4-alpha-glucan branching enzyme